MSSVKEAGTCMTGTGSVVQRETDVKEPTAKRGKEEEK